MDYDLPLIIGFARVNSLLLHIILSSIANATLRLNSNNYFRFQTIHSLFGIEVAKPFAKIKHGMFSIRLERFHDTWAFKKK